MARPAMPDSGDQLEFSLFDDEAEPADSVELPKDASNEVQKSRKLSSSEMYDLQQSLQKLARELANQIGMSKLAMSVRVEWNHRMRTAAGRAFYRKSLIELNPRLANELPRDRSATEIELTLKHELAHLVAFTRAGNSRIQPHGAEWKRACRDLGIPGEDRCHSLPFEPRRMKKKYLYACPRCEVEVPRVRPFKRPVACFSCCRAYNRGRYDGRFKLVLVEKKAS